MCDVQVLRTKTGFLFAKNSDREASEPQVVCRIPAVRGDASAMVQTTYVRIAQVPDRHAAILSRPAWLWGAEMGANEHGLIIGNTALYTRLASAEPGLIGMDLLRLALERCRQAEEALQLIVDLIAKHGQGGPCGFRDKGFIYDNAFLLVDPQQAWHLETAGKHFAARKVKNFAAISNTMGIGRDFDRASAGVVDLAQQFETRSMPILSGARLRRRRSLLCLRLANQGQASLATMLAHLRNHGSSKPNGFRHNHDVCMHAGHRLTRPSQATAAMVAEVGEDGLKLLFTGSSATCRSIFRPAAFDDAAWSVLTADAAVNATAKLWLDHESIQRRFALGLLDEAAFVGERDQLEAKLLAATQPDEWLAIDQEIAAWHRGWVTRAQTTPWRYKPLRRGHAFWRQLNRLDGIV